MTDSLFQTQLLKSDVSIYCEHQSYRAKVIKLSIFITFNILRNCGRNQSAIGREIDVRTHTQKQKQNQNVKHSQNMFGF